MAMLAPVIPMRRKYGRPSRADDLQIELDSRTFEERMFARDAAPLLRRLELIAYEYGPQAWHTVTALNALHTRHARRWSPSDPEGEAA